MNDLDKVAFILWFPDHEIEDITNDNVKDYLHRWKKDWMPDRNADHWGDCIKIPCACLRCQIDDLYNKAQIILDGLGRDE